MYVTIDENKCIGCNACIRVCPVHEANEAKISSENGRSIISINKSKCIGCGECVKRCEHGARKYIDDTERFFDDLKSGKSITLVVAPAFRLTEPNSDAILAHLRAMGVKLIYDVSFGADICTYMHIKAVKEKRVGKIMSQPCAALVEYILKYRQNLISSLSPVHSPISCTAVYLRRYAGVSGAIACISPCIAKKFEFEETGLIQYNVTFKRLVEYMESNIRYDKSQKFEFDNVPAYCGKIYPKPGGLKECLLHAVPDLDVRNSEGVSHIYPELDVYANAPEKDRPTVYDILSCSNGCISGPGTNFDEQNLFSYMSRANRVSNEAFKQREKQTMHKDKQFAWFEKNLKFEDFVRRYEPKNAAGRKISHQEIKSVFSKLMKETYTEQHFDCRACGYESCEKMATAIASGANIPENCHQYVIKQAEIERRNAMLAHQSVQGQNEKIISAVSGITDDIEKICHNTEEINAGCTQNSGEMVSVRETLDLLNKKCGEINAAVSGIIEVNDRYKEMSDAIQEITEQTHILSLNASVEAARAGEAGKSFAVVATEIRTLASNTRETTEAAAENDKFVKQETDKVLRVATEIGEAVNVLSTAMQRVDANVAQTAGTGDKIKDTAENIRSAAGLLRNAM